MEQLSNQMMIQCMLLTRTIMIIGPTNVQIVAEVGSGLIQQLNRERIQVCNNQMSQNQLNLHQSK